MVCQTTDKLIFQGIPSTLTPVRYVSHILFPAAKTLTTHQKRQQASTILLQQEPDFLPNLEQKLQVKTVLIDAPEREVFELEFAGLCFVRAAGDCMAEWEDALTMQGQISNYHGSLFLGRTTILQIPSDCCSDAMLQRVSPHTLVSWTGKESTEKAHRDHNFGLATRVKPKVCSPGEPSITGPTNWIQGLKKALPPWAALTLPLQRYSTPKLIWC